MLVCIAVFRTPVSALGAVGSAIAIAGSYVYAMAKTREKQLADAAAAEAAAKVAAAGEAESAPAKSKKPVDHPLFPMLRALGGSGLCG